MPEVCRFYGMVIQMFFDDHLPPHFHIRYQGEKVKISILDSSILNGTLPEKQKS